MSKLMTPARPAAPRAQTPGASQAVWAQAWLAFGLLLCLLVLALFTQRSWVASHDDVAQRLERLAQVNAGSLALVLSDAQRLQLGLSRRLQAGSGASADLQQLVDDELKLRFEADELVELFDARSGERLAASAGAGPAEAALAPQFARAGGFGDSAVGWAYSRQGSWWLPVFRRATPEHLIVVSVPVARVLAPWGKVMGGAGNPVGLRGPDDRILLRDPFTPEMMGADASPSASARLIRAAIAAGEGAGTVRTTATETDSVDRVIGWALLPGTGLTVLVALDAHEVTLKWARQAGAFVALLVLLLLSTAAVGSLAMRRLQLARRDAEQAGAAQRQALEIVEQALDASRDTTWSLGPDGLWHFNADLGTLLDGAPTTTTGERRALPWLSARLDPTERARLEAAIAAFGPAAPVLHHTFTVSPAGPGPGPTGHFVLKGRWLADAAGGAADAVAVGTLRDVSVVVEASKRHERLAATLQHMCAIARIGPWSVDADTMRMTLSREASQLWGQGDEETTLDWLSFQAMDGEHQARLQAARHRLLQTGVGYDEVLSITVAPGQVRWVRSVAVARRDANGRIVGLDGAAQDVTELVSARRALDAASWRRHELATAVAASAQLVVFVDVGQRISWCNAAFEHCTGWPLAEATCRRPDELMLREEMPAEQLARMDEGLGSGLGFQLPRVPHRRPDGRRFWLDLHVQPIVDAQDQLQGFVGVHSDVTQDIEREAQLREARDRFEHAARGAHIGVWEHWFGDDTRQWNSVMYELWGLPLDTPILPSERFLELMHPDDVPTIGADWQRALLDPSVVEWSGEFRVRAPQPTPSSPAAWRWMRLVATLERDAAGTALRGVGTMIDFSAERALQAEQTARAEAEAREQATKVFLSRTSHELRTPLNAVLGYAQLMRAEAASTDPRLQSIERAGWHLLSLIDDILDLSRIETGTLRVELRRVELAPLLQEVGELAAPLSDRQGVSMLIEPSDAAVVADPTRLRQALLNIVSNAVKYNRPQGQVRVTALRRGDQVEIRTVDTGPGLTAAQLQRLFTPFDRLGREGSPIDGTGLGLTITQALVRLMDGRLDVASTPGEGSVFTISLRGAAAPEARVVPEPAPQGKASVPPMAQVRRVLCVEDNEVNALMFTEALRLLRPQWPCTVAASIAQARETLRRESFDLVFLDLHLTDGEGLLLVGTGPGEVDPTRAVLLSADLGDEAGRMARQRGIEHRLGKPFRMADLDNLLRQLEPPPADRPRS